MKSKTRAGRDETSSTRRHLTWLYRVGAGFAATGTVVIAKGFEPCNSVT